MSAAPAILLDAGGVLLLPDDRAIFRELSAVGLEVDPAHFARAHYVGMRGVGDPGLAEIRLA